MANNRSERRAGKDFMTPEERVIKRSNIKDNFIIVLLIGSTFMNITLTYSLINLNTNVANFMADIFYNTPVNQATNATANSGPYIQNSDGTLTYLVTDAEHGDKYYYTKEDGTVIYPDEALIEYPVTVGANQPASEYISPSVFGAEPAGAHIHAADGSAIVVQTDADGKYYYIDSNGKTVYPDGSAVH